jgi:hypothetical protein
VGVRRLNRRRHTAGRYSAGAARRSIGRFRAASTRRAAERTPKLSPPGWPLANIDFTVHRSKTGQNPQHSLQNIRFSSPGHLTASEIAAAGLLEQGLAFGNASSNSGPDEPSEVSLRERHAQAPASKNLDKSWNFF